MANILYIVNVEGAIYDGNKWLIIRRSEQEEHAPGELSLVGGKVEHAFDQAGILEETLKREICEEVGIEVFDSIIYVESKAFTLEGYKAVVDIVFLCRYKSGLAQCSSTYEVSEVNWYTAQEILDNEKAPYYLKESISKAEAIRLDLQL